VPFLIQRLAGRNLTLIRVDSDALRIGRGTNQELRSDNPAVSLEHAVIERDAAGYVVSDRGSITGTYVNRKPVETARLSKGDVLEVGDLRLEIQMADPDKPLFFRIATVRAFAAAGTTADDAPSVAVPGTRLVKAPRIDYAGLYRLHRVWLTKLTVTAILLIVTLTVIGEVVLKPDRQDLFMPGNVSSAHARAKDGQGNDVAKQCEACHTPWKTVTSGKCLHCHAQQPHSMHESSAADCFDCHAEHRGATKLAEIPQSTCTACHSNLENNVRLSPENRAALRFGGGRYSFADIRSINAFDQSHPELAFPPDENTVRFNHQLHLAGKRIFNASGQRETLDCAGCHALQTVRGKEDPAPIRFDQHCQRCHRLTFDRRFPTSEVPHGGDPGIVYGFVVATYSGDRDVIGKSPVEARRILSRRKPTAPDQRAVFNADLVFKNKCRLCHEIQQKRGRSAVVPPVFRLTWLDRAGFTHGSHRNTACEQCHSEVRTSSRTGDVLMPRRAQCEGCHGPAGASQSSSSCTTCHEYHLRPKDTLNSASAARADLGGLARGGPVLQGILLATIIILLVVVLVPVGIALFQRLRPERPPSYENPAPPKVPRPVPPPMTTQTAARPGPSPPPAPPVPTASLPAQTDATRMVSLEELRPSPGGTEMMMWNGMLLCTAGPLEGQRFIIEDDGLYIGRDPGLAKVVVPDTRVSKRHVRIVPRDGKVWAIDEGSTNGTFIKGQRISEVALKRGDTLVLGDNAATFVYQI
jgi:pSer/pThr/pTyr-binding forkhead associated (FHA) protein